MATPTPTKRDHTKAFEHERRRQLRGLMLLAFAVIAFCILRAGVGHVFFAGWWRRW